MKKIIYIVCGIFIFGLIIENINFIYAENEENTLLVESNVIENNELNLEENINNLMDEYENEEIVKNEETSITNKLIDENNTDGLPKNEKIQTFEINQVYQEIDTSDYGIIRIKDPNNTGKGITIHDRNLGATATGAGVDESRESFGYYFQWGNNYGFSSDPSATISISSNQVDASDYGPNTNNGFYSSDTFIKGNNDWSSVRNDNLRGGSGDSKNSNGRGYPITNPEDRRGPCPENYHVPSIGEWSKLLEFWANEYENVSLSNDNGLYLFSNNKESVNVFYQRFNIPIAKQRDNYSIINNQNERSLFWSSSTYDSNSAFRFYGNVNGVFTNRINARSYAFPIRCFYNSHRLPVKITYDVNGGYRADEENSENKVITYTKIDDDSEYEGDITLGTIKKTNNCGENEDKKCMFGGWYTLTGDELWTGNISNDITLYAKRIPYEEKDISYSGVNFTIMDRNLGAETSGTGKNAYGYYLTGGKNDIICPEGYHVPTTLEWLGIKNLLGSDFNGDFVKNLLNLPFAGKMTNDEIVENEENGYYLAKYGNEIKYAKINNLDIEIKNLNEGEKFSARCFKDYNTGTIKFHTNGGDTIDNIIAVNRREEGEDLPIPSRSNSNFLGWYNSNEEKIENNVNYKNVEEIQLFAKWECNEGYQEKENICEKIKKKSGGSSGGGGTSRNNNVSSGTNTRPTELDKDLERNSQDSSANLNPSVTTGQLPLKEEHNEVRQVVPSFQRGVSETYGGQGDYPQEFIDAYNFAYKNGITSKPSIEDARMYSPLTRIQMAKMLSNYAINVLGKKPDISKGTIKFDDISNKLNKNYGNAITLAYQLGIMGQNIKNNKFRPYDEVTRAEFSTALSRLLYGTEDGKGKINYYEPHVIKLYNEGVLNNTNPQLKEKRGYIMLMLMRGIKL